MLGTSFPLGSHEIDRYPVVDGGSDGPDTVHRLVPFHLVLVFHLTGADQPIRPAQLKLAVWNVP